ncbi:MAG: hypothetical protein V1855_04870 [bacterium]
MISTENSLKKIKQLFSKRRVVDLDGLFKTLNTNSRATVFRRLKQSGYYSSYSHAGKFYTLINIPQFDADGLWNYDGIGFSKRGTLKETVLSLINESAAGQLQNHLENRLGIKVHNTLLDLVNSNQVRREVVDKFYLYLNRNSKRASKQISNYKKLQTGDVNPFKTLSDWIVIEVLAETIKGSYLKIEVSEICSRLRDRHIEVSSVQVLEIFKRYDIKKNQEPHP